uniref:Superoxide dismutase copper chaperone n=1 Tax=Gallus gallus TaxID=9031 RepID=A0A8V0X7P9_CHICK
MRCAGSDAGALRSARSSESAVMAGSGGSSCTLEFAVQMSCESCAEAVRAALEGAPGVRLLELRPETQTVLLEAEVGAERVKELLESSGRRAVLRGMGVPAGSPGDPRGGDTTAAVAALSGGVRGLVRFLQVSPELCVVDGVIDGLRPGPHGLHVHEFGDTSEGCESCGDHYNPDGECHGGPQDEHRHAGDLGNVWADAEGRAAFRMEDTRLKVWDIIGRSVVVDAEPQTALHLRRPHAVGRAGPGCNLQPHGGPQPHSGPQPHGNPHPTPVGGRTSRKALCVPPPFSPGPTPEGPKRNKALCVFSSLPRNYSAAPLRKRGGRC